MEKAAKVPAELKLDGDKAKEWKFFVQKLDIFMQASKMQEESEQYKCAVLLNCVGDKALQIYNTFEYSAGEDRSKFSVVKKKFEEFFVPSINETYERYIFFVRDMKQNETVDEYITELRRLSENCKFGTLCESLIKDRLVLGIQDKNVKDRLLRTKNLDLVKAIEICKSAEITSKQLEILCTGSSAREMEDQDVMRVQKTSQGSQWKNAKYRKGRSTAVGDKGMQPPEARQQDKISNFSNNNTKNFNKSNCNKCGHVHPYRACRAYGKRCRKCNQFNHFSQFCRNKIVHNIDINEEALFVGLVQHSKILQITGQLN